MTTPQTRYRLMRGVEWTVYAVLALAAILAAIAWRGWWVVSGAWRTRRR